MLRWRNPNIWKCQNCGYNGFVPTGDPSEFDFDGDTEENIPDDAKFGKESATYQKIGMFLLVIAVILLAVGLL